MTLEFSPWPKIPRLFRPVILTEKIDGTNSAVVITEGFVEGDLTPEDIVFVGDTVYGVYAQSRNRVIRPGDDNYGFAAWVRENKETLVDDLGPGRHFGEWWGSGIQRGYGLTDGERKFSVFNGARYTEALFLAETPGLAMVPVLATLPEFSTVAVRDALSYLASNGSIAQPGYTNPEGLVVFHSASRSTFKALLENDDRPKGAN